MSNTYPLAIPEFSDDGLVCAAAEPWFFGRIALIHHSAEKFIAKLASYADEFIFIDLFAGNGLFTIGHNKQRQAGTALALMASGLPFRRWILCERNADEAHALRIRTRRYFRDKQVLIFEDPLMALPEKLSGYVPRSTPHHRVAVLCIADSFSFAFPFEFVRQTLPLKLNFIIPFTFCINSRHDYTFYLNEQPDKLERFLGRSPQHTSLHAACSNRIFYKHLVRLYHQEMMLLGLGGSLSVHPLDSGLMELPAYYMGLFTSIPSVRNIQHEVQQHIHTQFSLFE